MSGTQAKVDRLGGYLAGLEEADLRRACGYLTGAAFPAGDPRRLQVGWVAIADVLTEITGTTQEDLHGVYLAHGDLGATASALFQEHPPAPSLFPRPLTLEAVDGAFGAIAAAQGPASRRAKQSVLRSLLRDAAPLEAKFLVKILTSDLRIGFRE